MELRELIKAVNERKLSKEQVENYRDELVNVHALMKLEMSDLEKEEALFMGGMGDESVAKRKVMWKASTHGLRLIQLKRYCEAIKPLIDSQKQRLYNLI